MAGSCLKALTRNFRNFEIGLNKDEEKSLSTRQHWLSLQFRQRDTELNYRSGQMDYIWVPVQYCVVLRAVTNWIMSIASFDSSTAFGFDWALQILHHFGPLVVMLLLFLGRSKPVESRVKYFDAALYVQIVADCVVEAAIFGRAGDPVPLASLVVMTANVLTHMPWYHHVFLGSLAFAVHAVVAGHKGTLSEVQTLMGVLVLPFMIIFARFADRALRQDFATRLQVSTFRETMAGYVEKFCSKDEAALARVKTDDTVKSLHATFELARKLTDRIIEAEQQQRLFLATMSHELRSPLSAMLNAVEVATVTSMDETGGKEAVAEMLQLMQDSGQHLLGVINDVLDFSALSSGMKVSIRPTTFSVHELGNELRREYEPRAQRKEVQLSVVFPRTAKGTLATADRRRLKQVAINFLSNAIKFTPAGGHVLLRVSAVKANGTDDTNDAGTLTVAVMDTGAGIKPEDKKMLFIPFAQGDTSLTREHGGTGLGLSIASRLVEAMGGIPIQVKSEVGEGSTFSASVPCQVISPAVDVAQTRQAARITLTQAEEPPSSADESPAGDGETKIETKIDSVADDHVQGVIEVMEREAPSKAPTTSNLRVLVAEDTKVVRALVKHMLWRAGVRNVEFAIDGEEATRAVTAAAALGTPFHVVLMDYHMPVCNGVEATKRIVAQAPPPAPPVIVGFTADSSDDAKAAFAGAGAQDVLIKPVTINSLERVLQVARRLNKSADTDGAT